MEYKRKQTYRKSYRKINRLPRDQVLCMYGKLRYLGKCVAYCDLHKCYLEPIDIKERQCNVKHCKALKNLGKFKDVEE